MARLTLRHVSKSFGATRVLRDVSIDVQDGEFLTLLGPSGCGKSTLLRIVAGLEPQDEGSVAIGDEVVDRLRPKDRNVAMVFQSYALYPHMTVAANLALPLQMRRLRPVQRLPLLGAFMPGTRAIRNGIAMEVSDIAKALDIDSLLQRKPAQLSGGQRQRVALARAMVRHPAVFLMDEPLSNLDAKLRTQMRTEIANLRRRLAGTFIYVTHDQTEAMTLSDRVAVMFGGSIVQLGSPQSLYSHPTTRQVAEFIGSPRINLLEGVVHAGGRISVASADLFISSELPAGAAVTVGLRPEALYLVEHGGPSVFTGRIQRIEHLGTDLYIYFHILGHAEPLVMRATPAEGIGLRPDSMIHVSAARGAALLFDSNGRSVTASASEVVSLRNHRRS